MIVLVPMIFLVVVAGVFVTSRTNHHIVVLRNGLFLPPCKTLDTVVAVAVVVVVVNLDEIANTSGLLLPQNVVVVGAVGN